MKINTTALAENYFAAVVCGVVIFVALLVLLASVMVLPFAVVGVVGWGVVRAVAGLVEVMVGGFNGRAAGDRRMK